MKRVHMLAANFIIHQVNAVKDEDQKEVEMGYQTEIVQPILMDFIKYMWEHKDDEGLYQLKVNKK